MKKIIICFSLVVLAGSLVFTFLEYNKYSKKKNELTTLQNNIEKTFNQLTSIDETIQNLKLEEQRINEEKKEQKDKYQKWERQNQVLKDLLN